MSQLLNQARDLMRTRHLSIRTEEAYLAWIKQYILFHHKQHPAKLGAKDVSSFLSYLATERHVSASTQNQALSAILFLYREVLGQEIEWITDVIRAHKPKHLPVVFSKQEVQAVLVRLSDTPWLMASLLYGSGLRLMECVRLRVQDIDFGSHQINVRDGKGGKDRVTVLPDSLVDPLNRHLTRVKALHEREIEEGFGSVYLPYALARKYPRAARDWLWQYVFPARRRSRDPRSDQEQRHHIAETVLQRAVRSAAGDPQGREIVAGKACEEESQSEDDESALNDLQVEVALPTASCAKPTSACPARTTARSCIIVCGPSSGACGKERQGHR